MNTPARWKVAGISAATFVIFITILLSIRAWHLQVSTRVQSRIVQVTALLLVVSVAYYSYCGGGALDCWILAFGPSQAFTLTLFLSGPTASILPVIGYAIVSAVLLSGTLGLLGFIVGRGGARITGTKSNNTPS